MFWFWIIRRHVAEGVEWFDKVLAAGGGSKMSRAYALLQAGFISTMVRQNDLEGCRAQIREARAQFVESGDAQGAMTAENYDCVMLWWLRDLDASNRGLTDIQAAHRSNGFEWGDAFCGWFLGSAAWLMGDMTKANEHYTRVLEIFRRIGDLTFIAWTLLPMANISLESGELDQATALYEQSLPMMGDIGDRHGVGAVLLGLGMTAQFRGESVEAQRLLVEAQTNLREGGAAAKDYPGRSRTFWSTLEPTICWLRRRTGIRRASTCRPTIGHIWCVPMERPGPHALDLTRNLPLNDRRR